MFCLSKGLCAPMGSMVVGSHSFIEKFNFCRKVLGGMLRKPGQMAAIGLICLNKMIPNLHKDHQMAKLLGSRLNDLPWIELCK